MIENGKEGKDVLAEVIFAVAVGGTRVQLPRLNHKFEEWIENTEAFLDGILFIRCLYSLRTLAYATEQTTANNNINQLYQVSFEPQHLL